MAINTQQAARVAQQSNIYSLDAIIAGTGIGVWALDLDTLQFKVCPTFKSLLGLPHRNAYNFADLLRTIAFSCRKKVIQEIKNLCSSGAKMAIEFMVAGEQAMDGRWFKITGKSYAQYDDQQGMYMGILTDVTEEKMKEIWNNDRLALLSHELKGPLSTIRLYLQRAGKISNDRNVGDIAIFMDKADEQVSAMSLLMDDFLSYSTIDNTRMTLCYEWFDMNLLVSNIAGEMQLKYPGYTFVIDVPSQHIRADKRKITQVILNYLTNAVKYSPAGSGIKVNCCVEGGELKMMVKDKGIGINPDYHQKVFDRYYRTPGTRAEGFGLGLYLVKEIINQHGGNVWVESTLHKGSSFYFSLPVTVSQ